MDLALIFGSGIIPKEVTDSVGIPVQSGGFIARIIVILFGSLYVGHNIILLYTIVELSVDLEITRRATVMIFHKLEGNKVKVKDPEQVTEAKKEVLNSIPDLYSNDWNWFISFVFQSGEGV